ncbi:MAG: preQ(1) synthase [Christensenellales bacterium]
MREQDELEKLTNLGSGATTYDFNYKNEYLERFENKFMQNDYMVSLDAYEFTCVCPKTGQPDFAKIYINYVPDEYLVESKSLKLYLFSFRNSGTFHEDGINTIMNDLVEKLNPKYLEVLGIFAPRGGIAIYPFASYAKKGGGYEEMKKQRQFDVVNSLMSNKRNYTN